MRKFYGIVREPNGPFGKLIVLFPDESSQGGIDALDGNQPVVSLYSNKRTANRILRQFRDDGVEGADTAEVKEIRIEIVQ